MKILRTGHEIADTVAAALEEGLYGASIKYNELPIGYGILRGTAEEFRKAANYIHLDRGYFKPNHYDGYYRISLNGTQQTVGLDKLGPDYDRLDELKLNIKSWRGFDKSKPVLVCPPTEHVELFFGKWLLPPGTLRGDEVYIVRDKSSKEPINFNDYSYVITFNSSVGWQALQAGIPCISDPAHSIVGKWFQNISLDNLAEAQYIDRHKLFATMAGLQLRLDEIRTGTKLWELLSKLLNLTSSSALTAANPLPPTLPLTVS